MRGFYFAFAFGLAFLLAAVLPAGFLGFAVVPAI